MLQTLRRARATNLSASGSFNRKCHLVMQERTKLQHTTLRALLINRCNVFYTMDIVNLAIKYPDSALHALRHTQEQSEVGGDAEAVGNL